MRITMIRTFALAAAAFLAAATVSLHAPAQDRPRLDVIYVPTPHAVVKRMLEIAKVGPDDIHYDLGSGDGRIAIASVKDFKAKKSVGIDLDPQRIKESMENLAKAGVGGRVSFLNRNIFETDFSEATVVSLYLLPVLNLKLRPAILGMKPGTRIVTQSFHMDDWKPDHTESVAFDEGVQGLRSVYLFVVPAKVEGKWSMADGERNLSLDIEQKFQEFGGTATLNGKSTRIRNGRLDGAKMDFMIEIDGKPVKYEGTVNGDTITGTGAAAWRASKS